MRTSSIGSPQTLQEIRVRRSDVSRELVDCMRVP